MYFVVKLDENSNIVEYALSKFEPRFNEVETNVFGLTTYNAYSTKNKQDAIQKALDIKLKYEKGGQNEINY
jgi:hypothetical protein